MTDVWFTTSFNQNLWEQYAHETLSTIFNHYVNPDDEIKLVVWLDSDSDFKWFEKAGVKFTGSVGILDNIDAWQTFIQMHGNDAPFKAKGIDINSIPEGQRFRFNYLPFARKVFAWVAAYGQAKENDIVVWLDADLKQKTKMTKEDVLQIVGDNDIVFLDRQYPWYAAETGWFAIRKNERNTVFVDFLIKAYITGFVFDMAEWHDGFIFKTALKMTVVKDTKLKSLTTNPTERDVFEKSCLSKWYEHLKGPGKFQKKIQKQEDFDTAIEFDPSEQDYKY